jgi:hypothetical protein
MTDLSLEDVLSLHIKGNSKVSINRKILAVLYFNKRYLSKGCMTIDEIRDCLHRGRLLHWRKINIARILKEMDFAVETSGSKRGRRLWHLTERGERFGCALVEPSDDDEPLAELDVATLESLLEKISDPIVRSYIEEAIKCLSVGALRAAIVFLWTGAIRTLQQEAFGKGTMQLNQAISKHDQRARPVGKPEDFAYIKDSLGLLAFQELGMLDKAEKDTLNEALNLRNRCGHPTKYVPGVHKASSFIEDVTGVVFLRGG